MSSNNKIRSGRGNHGGGGRRTGVAVGKKGAVDMNGLEDIDVLWENAQSPQASAEQTQEPTRKAAKKKPAKSALKKTQRFSLPGSNKVARTPTNNQDDNRSSFIPHNSKYIPSSMRNSAAVAASPSELSSVATLPPSPRSADKSVKETIPEEEDELSHHSVAGKSETGTGLEDDQVRGDDEDHDEEVGVEEEDFGQAGYEQEDQSTVTPVASVVEDPPPAVDDIANHDEDEDSFPADNDDDDEVVPPRPAKPGVGEEEEDLESDQEQESKHATPLSDSEAHDDDDGDDDKEGGSYDMGPNPGTPESLRLAREEEARERKETERASRKKKQQKRVRPKKTDKDDATVAVTPLPNPKSTKKKKGRKYVTFSPLGIQSGPREFESVPIEMLKKNEEVPLNPKTGMPCRRSGRAKLEPLKYWLGEKPVLAKHGKTGALGEAMGCMPTVSHIQRSLETPRKKRKAPPITENHVSKRGRRQAAFDSKKLRKKFDIIDDDEADVWTDDLEEVERLNVIARSKKMEPNLLPLPSTRKKSEGKVRGRASQAFNVPTDPEGRYVGYIMGQLFLPPGGIKDPESVGACSQLFTVCAGQEGSIEIAYSDPDENEGVFTPETAQRFLISPHDQFRVPPGNCYRIKNHSPTNEAVLAWVIIRPCPVNEQE